MVDEEVQSVCACAYTHVRKERKEIEGGEGEKEISEKQDEEINLYEVLINVNPT